MSAWNEFVKVGDTGKTARYIMVPIAQSNMSLGTIEWYSQWRRYIFRSSFDAILDVSCLADITEFLKELMEARKK